MNKEQAPKEPAVIVSNVTKSFRIPLEASSGLKQKLINALKGRKGYRDFTPLNDISFTIEKGDFFGIVGRNGSGKSTLLKTIAGIYNPNAGAVRVNGTLVPFIELGVGFNPELTGRENVYLNGALLGFSRDEMTAMYDDIVDFAELHDFMDERLKNYSSGMQVRLAFSIAIRAEGDILLLDEVLAVGDEAFQRKCFNYFGSLKRKGKTVILVTHDMGSVERFCNKAILIEEGSIVKLGRSAEIARMYQDLLIVNEHIEKNSQEGNKESTPTLSARNKLGVKAVSFTILQNDTKTESVTLHSTVTVRVEVESVRGNQKAVCAVNIINSQGTIVMGLGVGRSFEPSLNINRGINVIDFSFKNILTDDTYSINSTIGIYDKNGVSETVYQEMDILKFNSRGARSRAYAIAQPEIEYRIGTK